MSWEVQGLGEVGVESWGHNISGTELTWADSHASSEGQTHLTLLVGVLISLPEMPLINLSWVAYISFH